MDTLTVRPSGVLKHDDCPRAFKFQYVDRIKTESQSVNLSFGTAVGKGCTDWLIANFHGQSVDPVEIFLEDFNHSLSNKTLHFPTDKSPEDFLAIGKVLTKGFPDAWAATNLTLLIDEDGEPVVEKRLTKRVSSGIILSGTPDVMAMTEEGDVAIPDIKIPAQVASEWFVLGSEQLTSYQLLAEDPKNKAMLGIDRVDQLGFLEGIKRKVPKTKRGKGPTWEPIALTQRRSDEAVNELIQKTREIQHNLDRNYFPRRPRMAFNTPCDMCDYRGLCYHGDTTGLVFPQDQSAESQPIKLPSSKAA